MPRKSQPAEPRHAFLRPEDMRNALPRLRKRVEELRAVDISKLMEGYDAGVTGLEQKVISTLTDILGADTVEFKQFGDVELYRSVSIMIAGYGPSPQEVQDNYRDGFGRAIASLEALINLFEEKIGGGDVGESARARRQFADLDLHPEISRAAARLFEDGHYANAIEDACKALDGLVKMRSGRFDLSGTDLMQKVFSPNAPVLKFNDLKTESDESEQRGRMFLFAGAMLAVRNPRAHGLIEVVSRLMWKLAMAPLPDAALGLCSTGC